MDTTSMARTSRRLLTASIYLSQYQVEVHPLAGRLPLVPDPPSRPATATDEDTRRLQDDLPAHDLAAFVSEAKMDDKMRLRFFDEDKQARTPAGILDELSPPRSRPGRQSVRVKTKQTISINKSLQALSRVLAALARRSGSSKRAKGQQQ